MSSESGPERIEQTETTYLSGERETGVPCLAMALAEAREVAGGDAQSFVELLSAREPLQVLTDATAEYPLQCRACGAACLLAIKHATVDIADIPHAPRIEDCPLLPR